MPADRKALEAILAKGKASAEAERAAIQAAVVWWDKRVGPVDVDQVRSVPHKAQMLPGRTLPQAD